MSANLIPRQPKRKRQPTAACMREQLVLAADEIIRLREENDVLRNGGVAEWNVEFKGWPNGTVVAPYMVKRRPWWRRLLRSVA